MGLPTREWQFFNDTMSIRVLKFSAIRSFSRQGSIRNNCDMSSLVTTFFSCPLPGCPFSDLRRFSSRGLWVRWHKEKWEGLGWCGVVPHSTLQKNIQRKGLAHFAHEVLHACLLPRLALPGTSVILFTLELRQPCKKGTHKKRQPLQTQAPAWQ